MKKQHTGLQGNKYQALLGAGLTFFALAVVPGSVLAQNVTLTDGGSSAGFNLGGIGTGALGMNSWTVNADPGVSQLNQQWFWYSINGGGVQSIDQISAAVISGQTANGFTATFQNSSLAVQVSYSLQGDGGGSGGVLSETVNILDLSAGNLNVNFYQYGNFNLLQNNQNTVNIGGGPGAYSYISQTTSAGGNGIEETINQPYANFAEAGTPTGVMSDVTHGNALNGTSSYGPGNVAWALEWASTVTPFNGDAGNVWNVLQNQNMSIQPVPEPSAFALIAAGLGACGWLRRRRTP